MKLPSSRFFSGSKAGRMSLIDKASQSPEHVGSPLMTLVRCSAGCTACRQRMGWLPPSMSLNAHVRVLGLRGVPRCERQQCQHPTHHLQLVFSGLRTLCERCEGKAYADSRSRFQTSFPFRRHQPIRLGFRMETFNELPRDRPGLASPSTFPSQGFSPSQGFAS